MNYVLTFSNNGILLLDWNWREIHSNRSRAGLHNDEKNSTAKSLRDQSSSRNRVTIVRVEIPKCEYQESWVA